MVRWLGVLSKRSIPEAEPSAYVQARPARQGIDAPRQVG